MSFISIIQDLCAPLNALQAKNILDKHTACIEILFDEVRVY